MNNQIVEFNAVKCVNCDKEILSFDDCWIINELYTCCKECMNPVE